MGNKKIKITVYFYIGYLLILTMQIAYIFITNDKSNLLTPFHVVMNLVLWVVFSWMYLKKNKPFMVVDAVFTMAFTWLINGMIWDIIRQVLIATPYRITWRAYWIAQQPWSTLTYLAIFVAPFIGHFLWKKFIPDTPTNKRIVIVGGGIGGLTAGIYAAKHGFDTELYEEHTIIGGECTGWDREGYHIDNCIHWMMGTDGNTELNKLWQTVGAIGEGIGIKRANHMYTSELNGERLTLWQDIDRTEREMITISPEDEVEIRKLMIDCRLAMGISVPAKMPHEVMGLGELMKMSKDSGEALKLFKQYKGMNVQDLMDKFKHPLIKCLISDFVPADSVAHGFVMAYGNFVSGDGGIPEGGSRDMALRMQKTMESYGGKVFTGKGVKQILIEGNVATGILLNDGTKVACDYIIPACDTSVTFGKLLPKSYMEPLMKEMYERRTAYPVYNTFQVAFSLDSKEDLFPAEFIWEDVAFPFTEGMGKRVTLKSYSYEPSFAPKGKQILQTLQGGSEDVFEYWTELYKDKENYKKKKMELAELTMQLVEKRFPEFQGKLTIIDAWTPMTYVRYCSAYKGFYQSFMLSKDSAKMPYPSAYIKGLDNVVLGGQWINPPGGLPGAAVAGKFAVQRILYKEGKRLE